MVLKNSVYHYVLLHKLFHKADLCVAGMIPLDCPDSDLSHKRDTFLSTMETRLTKAQMYIFTEYLVMLVSVVIYRHLICTQNR